MERVVVQGSQVGHVVQSVAAERSVVVSVVRGGNATRKPRIHGHAVVAAAEGASSLAVEAVEAVLLLLLLLLLLLVQLVSEK